MKMILVFRLNSDNGLKLCCDIDYEG